MENLQRRASGIYVARLTVPERFRHLVGKRELIATTGTTHLPIAKLVAGTLLTQWRQQLLDLERLALTGHSMKDESILKIADGHPLLSANAHLPIRQAATVLGLSPADLLRMAESQGLALFARFNGAPGFLCRKDDERKVFGHDAETGVWDVPQPYQMPATAVRHEAVGVRQLLEEDAPSIANALAVTGEAEVVVVWSGRDAGLLFVPDEVVRLTLDTVEVSTGQIDRVRKSMAATFTPDRIEAARSAVRAPPHPTPTQQGKHATRRVSEGLELYAAKFLPQKISNAKEIERVKSGIGLFILFEGDIALGDIDADRLRTFRDEKLATVPAKENLVRAKFGTASVLESIQAVKGTDWPVMSADERDLRIEWIRRMLGWLVEQGWIAQNPAMALRGESSLTKAERKRAALGRKDREPFTPTDLRLIFGQDWFASGTGERTRAGTFRTFSPVRYWLPLLGLFTGGRINELCQLWLDDVRQTDAGTWFLDLNENTPDKSLKKQKDEARCWSARKVPLHPRLIELGFPAWCQHLREAGYRRVFPELSWNATNHYAKDPIRAMSQMFERLGMPRDNTKVFHSFRHTFNNAIMRMTCPPEIRKRLVGHAPGEGVNEQHYLKDPTPDEAQPIIASLNFDLPHIAPFAIEDGLEAIQHALRRKNQGRGGGESLGPANP